MIQLSIIGILIVALIVVTTYLKNKIKNIKVDFENQRTSIRIDAKKRSGAVQWGLAIENFAPFMDEFPLRPEDVNFLGKPIDYIGYTDTDNPEECKVHFIEVKSGSSQLLKHQRNIKNAILQGRVYWHEVRVKSNKKKDSK